MGRVEDFVWGRRTFWGKQGATKESYGRRVYLYIQEFTGDYDIPWN